ncbi:hypothetical protein [Nocardioides sp.]|uniref:hypothetical protein n=1 Tax=Nocardioides sp. TaxID=35761 RepID=UPI0039E4077F
MTKSLQTSGLAGRWPRVAAVLEPATRSFANKYRSDVGATFPGVGNYHRYDETWAVPHRGAVPVYIYPIGQGNTFTGNPLAWSGTVSIS